MNLDLFQKKYKNQKKLVDLETRGTVTPVVDINELFQQFGGYTFEKGIFRIHNFETSEKWTKMVYEGFPVYSNKLIVFGFDWLGRPPRILKKILPIFLTSQQVKISNWNSLFVNFSISN